VARVPFGNVVQIEARKISGTKAVLLSGGIVAAMTLLLVAVFKDAFHWVTPSLYE
jgi:hypothetical protein